MRAKKKLPPPPVPGEIGWLHIAYTGKAPDVRMWPGEVTGQLYPFGGARRHGKVDKRDALKFLTQRLAGGAEPIWKLYRVVQN